jgi:hypothetical protein|nr:MAG TPA: hypothetical protein [Bacteriophage sp.]
MADLKTNYVDDVLDTTKNQLRKYQQIQNDDGTVSFVDVTEYTKVGTPFGAKDINDTNAAINDVNGNLDTKIQIITLSEKTGTDSNSGIIYIPKTSYPDAKCIIPFAYDSTLAYRIGIFDVSTNSFRFAVQTAVNGAWADSKTITFSALIIK